MNALDGMLLASQPDPPPRALVSCPVPSVGQAIPPFRTTCMPERVPFGVICRRKAWPSKWVLIGSLVYSTWGRAHSRSEYMFVE